MYKCVYIYRRTYSCCQTRLDYPHQLFSLLSRQIAAAILQMVEALRQPVPYYHIYYIISLVANGTTCMQKYILQHKLLKCEAGDTHLHSIARLSSVGSVCRCVHTCASQPMITRILDQGCTTLWLHISLRTHIKQIYSDHPN